MGLIRSVNERGAGGVTFDCFLIPNIAYMMNERLAVIAAGLDRLAIVAATNTGRCTLSISPQLRRSCVSFKRVTS